MVPVVADADTLFGATTRGLLIHLDYQGVIRLHWSPLILDEMSRALVDTGRKPDAESARRHEQFIRAEPRALSCSASFRGREMPAQRENTRCKRGGLRCTAAASSSSPGWREDRNAPRFVGDKVQKSVDSRHEDDSRSE